MDTPFEPHRNCRYWIQQKNLSSKQNINIFSTNTVVFFVKIRHNQKKLLYLNRERNATRVPHKKVQTGLAHLGMVD